MRRLHTGLLLLALFAVPFAWGQTRWYRGNTHTHTVNSDGDSSPDVVVRWYKEHRYNFVVITDHNYRTPVEGLNAVFGAPEKFLVLGGVEVTGKVHINALNVAESLQPLDGANQVEVMDNNVRAIRAAGGLAHVNHPNYQWLLTADQITAATEVKHFELANALDVNNWGGFGTPSTEEMWDLVLSSGRVLYGLASDDAHHFQGEFSAARSNPGRGWIMVRAPELSASALITAIDRGDFYATTGVEIRDYEVTPTNIRLTLPVDGRYAEMRYATFFIGRGGQVLKQDLTAKPTYNFKGDELYVRVRVQASSGAKAWLQPVFPQKR